MASLVYYMVFGDGMSFMHDDFKPFVGMILYVISLYFELTKVFVVCVQGVKQVN
jgi:hypothetical protein